MSVERRAKSKDLESGERRKPKIVVFSIFRGVFGKDSNILGYIQYYSINNNFLDL